MNIDEPEILKQIGFTLLAFIGGALGYLMRTLDARQKIKWGFCLLNAVAAGFVGFIVLLLCLASNLSFEFTGAIVGIAGWLGADKTMRQLEKSYLKKVGLAAEGEPIRERANDSNSDVPK